jgi:hypothetical protein
VILATLALLLAAPERPHIAVFDVRPQIGVTEQVARAVSDQVTLEVRRMNPEAAVMGADEVRAYLAQIERFPAPGCQEARCMSEIGGVVGAQRIVFGTLARNGADYLLVLQLVDVERATVLKTSKARLSGNREESLLNSTETLVEDLLMEQRPRLIHAGCTTSADCPGGSTCGVSGRCESSAQAAAKIH